MIREIMKNQVDIEIIKAIALAAGKEIMEIYETADFTRIVDFKADNSPLTTADKASHHLIVNKLKQHFPAIPIISEEGSEISYGERKNWDSFWLVDPLDGTKEFINRNGEFTVNIALIEGGLPVLGVVYVPVKKTFYYGDKDGAFKQKEGGEVQTIRVGSPADIRIAVRSRSHASPEEEGVMQAYGITEAISAGSSLKFCLVAEGAAHLYYRHGPTMEWDTAAGQAVVQAAGGAVYSGHTEKMPFTYNKESLLNGSFLCLGDIARK